MKRIFTARDAMEAHFVKSLLENAGIEAVIEGEFLQQIRGDIPFTMDSLPKVCVREEDFHAAEVVVNAHRARLKNRAQSQGPSWTCVCGETHAAQFAACWKCGAAKPSDTDCT